jgi:hypothetical protein
MPIALANSVRLSYLSSAISKTFVRIIILLSSSYICQLA